MGSAIVVGACLVLFGAPLASMIVKARRDATGQFDWRLPSASIVRMTPGRTRQTARETFCVADTAGRVRIALVSEAVVSVVTSSLQPTRFTVETIARSEGWAILADPGIWPQIEQHHDVLMRDLAKGIQEFVAERRNGGFSFHFDGVIPDPDLLVGEIRVVPSVEGKSRATKIKQDEIDQREAREHRVRIGADGRPQLTRTHGEGRDSVSLRPGTNVIGRHPDKGDGQVLVATVSRTHAVIEIDEFGAATIEDQESLHGTFVNDGALVAYERTPLPHGALVRLGKNVVYRYDAGSIGFTPTAR